MALLLQTQAEIEKAVAKGLDVVKRGDGELALWTLVECGVPDNDPALQRLLGDARPPESTTSAALQAMIFESLDRLKYRHRIAHGAQLLIDTQCRDGRWGVGHPVAEPVLPAAPARPRIPNPGKPQIRQKVKLEARGKGGETGDPALSRWALWGLRAAHDAGLIPPAEVVERAAAAVRISGGDAADVVSCLCVGDYLSGKDWRRNPDVLKAVERLAGENRTETKSLYALDRAMMHFNSETLGGVAWYPRSAKILLAAQREDGSWGGLEETCYATLALHKRRLILHEPVRK